MSEKASVIEGANRPIAMLIAVLALFLALSEMMGKNAETDSLAANVDASNLWAFFQAKTIRQTTLRTAAEQMDLALLTTSDQAAKVKITEQIGKWRATAERYESDPKDNDGRKELMARAKAAEAKRDLSSHKDDLYEYSSAAFQIGIVLASAAIITGMIGLAGLAGVLGAAGLVVMCIAAWAPLLLKFA